MAKTVQEQLDAALARVEKLRAKLNAVTILANVDVGNRVEFTFGRAEKKRTLSGVVIAVGEDAKAGKLAAIQSGEGRCQRRNRLISRPIYELETRAPAILLGR